jgi:hypothetical protein
MYRIEKIIEQRLAPLKPVSWALCQFDRSAELFYRARSMEENLPEKSVVRYPGGKDDGWSDVGSLTEAVDLGLYGWRDGEKLMEEKIAQAFIVQRLFPRKSAGVDVAGAYPFVPAAVAGDPLCMVTPTDESVKTKPIVRIIVNVAVSGNVPREVIYARGGAILAWVDELESSGYRCEIVIIESGLFGSKGDKPKGIVFMATGKTPEEPLDIDRMGYLLCHPSVQRRIFFSLYEGDRKLEELGFTKAQLMTYGQPTDEIPKEFIGEHSVYFPAMRKATDDWASPVMAAAAVERMVIKNLQLEDAEKDASFDTAKPEEVAAVKEPKKKSPEPESYWHEI